MDLAKLSDEELVEEYRGGSDPGRRSIADALFERHYDRVARWCFRFTGDRDAALDLAQDVFLKAHRHLDGFQGHSRFSTWLYAIVRNESFSRTRRVVPFAESSDEQALVDAPATEPGPEDQATDRSRHRKLMAFLASTLDEQERLVFTLHFGDGVPLEAITRLLRLDNTSGAKAYVVSAKRKLARAVQRLRARGERW
jgi:RNA polymerase sigma-70 factor (ECF subfamily)